MREAALVVAVLALAASPFAMRSASAGSAMAVAGHPNSVIKVAEGCGPGFHWVGAHRDSASGRWVPGHCAHN